MVRGSPTRTPPTSREYESLTLPSGASEEARRPAGWSATSPPSPWWRCSRAWAHERASITKRSCAVRARSWRRSAPRPASRLHQAGCCARSSGSVVRSEAPAPGGRRVRVSLEVLQPVFVRHDGVQPARAKREQPASLWHLEPGLEPTIGPDQVPCLWRAASNRALDPEQAVGTDVRRDAVEWRVLDRVLLVLRHFADPFCLEHLGGEWTQASVRALAADAGAFHEPACVVDPVVHRDRAALECDGWARSEPAFAVSPLDVIVAGPDDGEAAIHRHRPDILGREQ